MKYVIVLLLLASCAPRKIDRIEKIQIRTIDTTIITPPEYLTGTRPLRFMETIVVENERVRTEVLIDTVLKTVEVNTEVKEQEHEVKMNERTETNTKTKTVERGLPWWGWWLIGVLSAVIIYLIFKL